MIRTLLWKEYREQRMTIIALAVFANGLLLTIEAFGDSSRARFTSFGLVTACLVWLIGLVIGAQTFASEVENRTMFWLDSLPVSRRVLGRTKIVFAVLTTTALAAILLTVCVAKGWIAEIKVPDAALAFTVVSLSAVGCGLLGSTLASSSLGAVLWAIPIQALFVLGIWDFSATLRTDRHWAMGWDARTLVAIVCVVLPFFVSVHQFGRLDRRRRLKRRTPTHDGRSWRSLAWLVWRQSRLVAGVLFVAGVVAAILLPIGQSPPVWPAIGLVLGIVAGIGTFSADRPGEAHRFLGDRRFPPSQIWLTKTALGLLIALLPMLLQLAGVGIYLGIRSFELSPDNRHVMNWLRSDYLVLGPLYGFAIGQVLGMICRKGAVAFVLSAMIGVLVLLAWWPSTLIGGLHIWQWSIPPLVLIATTGFLARPWLVGRLSDRRVALGSVATVLLATLLMVGGVAYRIAEVPDRAAPFDVAAFEASLPTPEQNQAILKITKLLREFKAEHYDKQVPVLLDEHGVPRPGWMTRAGQAVHMQAWPNDDEELNQKLDEFAALPILADLRSATALPLGMADFPAGVVFSTEYRLLGVAQTLGQIIGGRALQLASRGRTAEAFELMFVMLDLSRHLQSKSNHDVFLTGVNIERNAMLLIPPLAESPGANSEILANSLSRFIEHIRAIPLVTDSLKIDYLAALSVAKNGGVHAYGDAAEVWTLPRIAAMVPWEMSRSIHILNSTYAGFFRTDELTYQDAIQRIDSGLAAAEQMRWVFAAWTPPSENDGSALVTFRRMRQLEMHSIWSRFGPFGSQLIIHEMISRVSRRAALLQLALAAYERRQGKPASTMTELVPDFISEVPIDPYGMQPFRYRVSNGEKITWHPGAAVIDYKIRDVQPGQGIIWSVGGDMQDDGGRVNGANWWGRARFHPGRDIVFLAPLIKKP